MEEDVPTDPRVVGLLGAAAIVLAADGRADAVEESRLRCGDRAYLTDDRRGDSACR
jgi:hypothetical protein